MLDNITIFIDKFFDTVLGGVGKFFQAIPFSSPTWFIIAILSFVVWLFYKAHRDVRSPIRWEHLIIDTTTNRASPYKLGYLVGVIVSTWLMLYLADAKQLTFDLLGVYLTFLLGGSGWSSFVSMKSEDKTTMRAKQMLAAQTAEKEQEQQMPVKD